MATGFSKATAAALTSILALSACEEGVNPFSRFDTNPTQQAGIASIQEGAVERDVEAPEVFSISDRGLWDGRPSLGGVWVAHPDVQDPERVIVRNESNGAFVIGALFRRDRLTPGPSIQVSSDAAVELRMLAGQPADLSVIALRREQVPVSTPVEDIALAEAVQGDIETQTLDPVASAAAAIEAAPAPEAPSPAPAEPVAAAAPAPAPAAAASTLDRPFIQIGIFSIEQNAINTATSLRNIGIVPTILRQSSQGKTFWRVIVGPTTTENERRIVRDQVRQLGFDDAYFVTN